MNLDNMIICTDVVPVYDEDGIQIDEIRLPEKIVPVPRRRCGRSKSQNFYKGAGIIYQGHYVNEASSRMMIVSRNTVEYQKYYVVYPKLYQVFGIFTFCHQPIFSDCEGGCGRKEKNIITMQEKFEFSAINEIVDVINVPISEHNIYVYRLKEMKGSYKDTIQLIEYILTENYNSAWDKNLWNDIMSYGYVRDLADWFESKELHHKLGTIYALLNSLLKADKYTYEDVVRETTGLEQLGEIYLPYIAAKIVEKYCPDSTAGLDLSNFSVKLYERLWEVIYAGKYCCHLEYKTEWDHIREIYMSKIPNHLDMLKKELESRSIH